MVESISYQGLLLVLVVYSYTGSSYSYYEMAPEYDEMASSQHFDHFETQTNQRIKAEFTYLKVRSNSAVRCAAHCSRSKDCMSASYSVDGQFCYLSTYIVNTVGGQDRLLGESSWRAISVKGCLDDWHRVGETCYYFGIEDERAIQSDAKQFCEDQYAMLAEPRTNATLESLLTYMLNVYPVSLGVYWIGLKFNDGGFFEWISNGDTLGYQSWTSGFPAFTATSKCVQITCLTNRKMANDNCSQSVFPLCEM